MSDNINRLENKLDKQNDKLTEISQTLVRNTTSLEEHVRRTDLLEKEIIPIKKHVMLMNTLAKIGTVLFSALIAAKEFHLF